uniref:Uncharacterized protein n=1 Tax=Branchiostoma floridae TaxID=7739 RepID=C3YRR5_BRAFL|eukprot:XP_002600808.1 hypothetical protein BRAFLDRAFT_95098 [Branchiostoma floridae]
MGAIANRELNECPCFSQDECIRNLSSSHEEVERERRAEAYRRASASQPYLSGQRKLLRCVTKAQSITATGRAGHPHWELLSPPYFVFNPVVNKTGEMYTNAETEEREELAGADREETQEKITVPPGVEEAGANGNDPDCSDEEDPCCGVHDKKRRKVCWEICKPILVYSIEDENEILKSMKAQPVERSVSSYKKKRKGIKKLVTVYEGSFLQAEEELKTVGVCMVSLLVFVVPSVIVVIAGSSHLHECADRPMVPLLLITGGAIGLLKGLFGICCETRAPTVKPGGEVACPSIRCVAKLLSWCLVLWVATCSVIIYFDIDTCKADLYNVLLWTVLACYVGAVVLLICQCCSNDKEETKQIQNDVTTLTNTTVQERIEMVFG